MDFLPEHIEQYAIHHSQQEPLLLQELSVETHQKILNPRMLSGAFQGRFLSLFSKLINPKNILEIGTYTGYSALCLAEGLQRKGTLYTIDINEELENLQNKYFEKSGYRKQIKQYIGDALEIIPALEVKFDLVFIDADKKNYIHYFNAIIDKINKGGVILSDNVLWSGKVTEPLDPNDEDTKTLAKYNELLKNDARLQTILLPIRDGLSISRVL